nr:hypothetical protein [Pseudotabrizicola sediminis]
MDPRKGNFGKSASSAADSDYGIGLRHDEVPCVIQTRRDNQVGGVGNTIVIGISSWDHTNAAPWNPSRGGSSALKRCVHHASHATGHYREAPIDKQTSDLMSQLQPHIVECKIGVPDDRDDLAAL